MKPPYVRTGTAAETEEYLSRRGQWTVANLRQSIGWTKTPITIEYSGHTLALLPEDTDHVPAIATLGEGDVTRRLILEFASALTWTDGGEMTIEH
ncbi:MAG TPA: hypothetical protein VN667_14250, partial [Burkholderiales bacterium]|nr:hypothetical protein [Burkholderiales bacterium]